MELRQTCRAALNDSIREYARNQRLSRDATVGNTRKSPQHAAAGEMHTLRHEVIRRAIRIRVSGTVNRCKLLLVVTQMLLGSQVAGLCGCDSQDEAFGREMYLKSW